jgi:hypothetical protein
MKQCPKCGTTYSDPGLSFCLADGTVLEAAFEQPTIIVPASHDPPPVRADIPQELSEAKYIPRPDNERSQGSWLKIALVIGLVLIMLIGAAVVAGALIYFNKDSRTVTKNPTAQATPANTNFKAGNQNAPADGETDKLREQIANLEKRLDEQKNAATPRGDVPAPPDQPSTTSASPTVNSPGDGFLALRSLPSSDAGERVLKIPNGARVSISGCLPRTHVENKTGRWCKASYNGYSGWLFDAWLVY